MHIIRFWLDFLAGNSDWLVKSNVERQDPVLRISYIVETEDPDAGIIFELKCARERSGLDKACEKAMEQIRDRGYEQYLENDGRHNLLLYGIAFYKKDVRLCWKNIVWGRNRRCFRKGESSRKEGRSETDSMRETLCVSGGIL